DTAFFDKRSKFVHYCPSTLVLNNLEYDHADIFPDLAAIQKQFHHLLRIVPGYGQIITPTHDQALADVITMGCWSEQRQVGPDGDWEAQLIHADGSAFNVLYQGTVQGRVNWSLIGMHNIHNALMAIAAAHHVGVPIATACVGLSVFQTPKRRLEVKGVVQHVTIYDDFAHHPTAIATTLDGLRKKVGKERIIAVLEPRSNTMKLGVHKDTLAASLEQADAVLLLQPGGNAWQFGQAVPRAFVGHSVDELLAELGRILQPHDHVLMMSNGGFGHIHQRLLEQLQRQE
ncbi:MAG TPA: UDP-N-acetylmuramate:L-alanyl-gamma-D-glutamyl-meso-diaminopimelate ligase, partial [Pseudidiomarina sp.]|nr:UDP-N-acetylmuramate:L-alanyl-gamma-D-glutamyl-meso-diaminopimelate ligase [Pseudidiomarina sp.]